MSIMDDDIVLERVIASAQKDLPAGVRLSGTTIIPRIKKVYCDAYPLWVCEGLSIGLGISPEDAYRDWCGRLAAYDHSTLFSPIRFYEARNIERKPWYKRIFK